MEYEVVVKGILDEYVAEAIAQTLRNSGLPDSITVEVRPVTPDVTEAETA